MFSMIRKRLTYANVIVTLALVFAMTGGAYAAKKYLITSTAQISPKVLKSLQGKTGPVGPAGAAGAGFQGPQGPAGPAGAKGETGPAGTKGTNGANGANGTTGATGPKGTTGSSGVTGSTGATGQTGFTETLPSGKTETGVWALRSTANAEGEIRVTALSFPIPLKALIGRVIIIKPKETPNPEECTGSVSKPEAQPDNLCIFEGEAFIHKGGLSTPFALNPSGSSANTETSGVELAFETLKPTTPGEEVSAEGTFAVTAE